MRLKFDDLSTAATRLLSYQAHWGLEKFQDANKNAFLYKLTYWNLFQIIKMSKNGGNVKSIFPRAQSESFYSADCLKPKNIHFVMRKTARPHFIEAGTRKGFLFAFHLLSDWLSQLKNEAHLSVRKGGDHLFYYFNEIVTWSLDATAPRH